MFVITTFCLKIKEKAQPVSNIVYLLYKFQMDNTVIGAFKHLSTISSERTSNLMFHILIFISYILISYFYVSKRKRFQCGLVRFYSQRLNCKSIAFKNLSHSTPCSRFLYLLII